jgi:RecJ-like exonuclease
MENYAEFKNRLELAVSEFRKLGKEKPVRVISHMDADGISACSILLKALRHENILYSVTIVKQLTKGVLYDLSHENYDAFFFADIGSGQLKDLKNVLGAKKVFIFDHHKIESDDPDIIHVNPELFGISGSTEISGSGVVYFFYKALTGKKNMAHIAVIGAIGDVQEDYGFSKLNTEIVEDAKASNSIEIKKGLRIFGLNTKPLYKALQFSTWPMIPGVSGSESSAVQFLQELGINPKQRNKWRMFSQLTEKEVQKLAAGIVMKRANKENPEDVFGPIYNIVNEPDDSPTKDAREYATLLNACGRLDKASFALGTCLGDEKSKMRAISVLKTYKRELVNALNWFEKNKKTERIIENDGIVIINAKADIRDTLIGTLASIISKSHRYRSNTFVLAMARNTEDDTTKISLRIAGGAHDIDLRQILKLMVLSVDGSCGGHKRAAGGRIAQEKEQEFIKNAKQVLEKAAIEEKIR